MYPNRFQKVLEIREIEELIKDEEYDEYLEATRPFHPDDRRGQ